MPTGATVYVSLFFAGTMAVYQLLHCFYVVRDPDYKGKLGLGWPWFHNGIVDLSEHVPLIHNYAFQSTLTLFAGSFVIALAVLEPVFSSDAYVQSSLVLVIVALTAVGAFSQMMGPGGYKGFLALFSALQVGVLCFATFRGLPGWYLPATIPVTLGAGFQWTQLMHARLRKSEQRHSVYTMGLYGVGSVVINWVAWALLCLAVL